MNAANPFGVYECFMNTRPPESPAAAVSDEIGRASTKADAEGADAGALLGPIGGGPTETGLQTALETVSAPKSPSPQASSSISTPRLTQTPSVGRRLPRFARAKRSWLSRLALQDRDLELIRIAYDYRLISTPQFLRLLPDESRDGVYRRLQKLFHHGYLDRLGTNPNAPL